MSARVAVLSFPGSCDDRDAAHAVEVVGGEPVRVWHDEPELPDVDAVIVPGGFSFGDYLRPGAIAALSPAMRAVSNFAGRGGPVLGICNGFQVLTEAGLLPGALRPNTGLRFRCIDVRLVVERESPWLPGLAAGEEITIPMKHHDGCYVASPELVAELERDGCVLLRYADDVNGSVGRIAGVTSAAGNVAALMPHPEHAVDALLGSTDGRILLGGLLALAGDRAAA
jgi:phosphoribosylformylglycinamidine synthase subunit PurQ / glutaminase